MTHTENFRIYYDKTGKCPILSHIKLKLKSHPYYIRYQDNRPVAYHGPPRSSFREYRERWCLVLSFVQVCPY